MVSPYLTIGAVQDTYIKGDLASSARIEQRQVHITPDEILAAAGSSFPPRSCLEPSASTLAMSTANMPPHTVGENEKDEPVVTPSSYDEENVGTATTSGHLHRDLHSRHMQMIAIGMRQGSKIK